MSPHPQPIFISRSSATPHHAAPHGAAARILALLAVFALGYWLGWRGGAEVRPGPSFRISPPATPRIHLHEQQQPPAAPTPAVRTFFIRC